MSPRVNGTFLAGPGGRLAVVLCEPPPGTQCVFAVLCVPPAGDEMNKSRRMTALQARALARIGGMVALLDPRGTGDSAGEHGNATWDGWCADVAYAWEWLAQLTSVPRMLWGIRLGGLLTAELVAKGTMLPEALVLWQPVISGRSYFNQLLRFATAQKLTGRNDAHSYAKSLRAKLDSGSTIEVAGYELHPALIAGAEAADLDALVLHLCPVIWRDTNISSPPILSPAATRVVERWKEAGVAVDVAAVSGPSFWASQEITDAPELVASTTASIAALASVFAGAHRER